MSALCKHYGWAHDFWRKMGRNEFFAWVEQLNEEGKRHDGTDRWDAADQDDGWEKMREKRRRWRGR